MELSYLLLGGNLGDREAYLAAAREAIAKECGKIEATSALYETEAWGLKEQAAFLNQALAIETVLSPKDLLTTVLSIEQCLGRVREEKYGPRTIDIDILFYDDAIIDLPHLTVPHPFLHQRRFALVCLSDIAPHFIHPIFGKEIYQLLKECADSSDVHKF